MNAIEDAFRMAHAAWTDGHDDRWHQPFAALQGEHADAVFSALRAGQRQAIADDAAMWKNWKPAP